MRTNYVFPALQDIVCTQVTAWKLLTLGPSTQGIHWSLNYQERIAPLKGFILSTELLLKNKTKQLVLAKML